MGRYQLTPQSTFSLEHRDDQAYVQLAGQTAYPVFLYETDKFFCCVIDAHLHFVERTDDGQIDALVRHQGGVQRAPKLSKGNMTPEFFDS